MDNRRGGGMGGMGGGRGGGRGGYQGGRGGGSGGISKGPRRGPRTGDRDGDLDMGTNMSSTLRSTRSRTSGIHKGGAPIPRGPSNPGRSRGPPPSRPPPTGPRNLRSHVTAQSRFGLVDVKVTGWGITDRDRDDVIEFLEERANVKVKKVS